MNHGHVFIREEKGSLRLAGERLKRKGNRGCITSSALWDSCLSVESLWNEVLPGLPLAYNRLRDRTGAGSVLEALRRPLQGPL